MTREISLDELYKFFGSQRAVELLGWARLLRLLGRDSNGYKFIDGSPVAVRKELDRLGYGGSSSFYRALRDLRRFGENATGTDFPRQDHNLTMCLFRALDSLCPNESDPWPD